MPITQARMLAVLGEAREAHDALGRLKSDIRAILAGDLKDSMACAAIGNLLDSQPTLVRTATMTERNHFEKAKRRNDQNARAMRERRAGR